MGYYKTFYLCGLLLDVGDINGYVQVSKFDWLFLAVRGYGVILEIRDIYIWIISRSHVNRLLLEVRDATGYYWKLEFPQIITRRYRYVMG